jgi:type II secretory pathway pseudopilin PulG
MEVGTRAAGRERDDGYAMIAMLLVVVILGVMAAIVLGGGTQSPSSVAVATKRTAVAACLSDYITVETAVQSYFAANLADPPAGTTWATAAAHGGPYLVTWPRDPRFYSLTWNGSSITIQPKRGLVSIGSGGTRSPRTGCFAA